MAWPRPPATGSCRPGPALVWSIYPSPGRTARPQRRAERPQHASERQLPAARLQPETRKRRDKVPAMRPRRALVVVPGRRPPLTLRQAPGGPRQSGPEREQQMESSLALRALERRRGLALPQLAAQSRRAAGPQRPAQSRGRSWRRLCATGVGTATMAGAGTIDDGSADGGAAAIRARAESATCDRLCERRNGCDNWRWVGGWRGRSNP